MKFHCDPGLFTSCCLKCAICAAVLWPCTWYYKGYIFCLQQITCNSKDGGYYYPGCCCSEDDVFFSAERSLDMRTGGDSQKMKVSSLASITTRVWRGLSLHSLWQSPTPLPSIPQWLRHNEELPLKAAPSCTYCNTGEVTGQASSTGIKVSVSFVETEFRSITLGKSGGKSFGNKDRLCCAAARPDETRWISAYES